MLPLILAFIAFVAVGLSFGMLNVAWPSIRDTFELSLDAVGLLLMASTGGSVFASSITGRLIERLEMGRLAVLSSLVLVLGLIGYAVSPGWWFMVALAILAGMGSGWIDSGLNIYIAQHHSGRAMNWLHACFGLGATLGPYLMTVVLSRGLSWRLGYWIAAGVQAAMLVVFLLALKRWRSVKAPSNLSFTGTLATGDSRGLLLWMSIALFFLYAGTEVTAGQWSFPLFTESRGIDLETAGTWVSIYWGSLTIGRLLFGFIVNQIGATVTLRLGFLGVIIGAIGFLIPVEAISFAGLALIGFAQAPIFPVLISETPKRLGPTLATRAIGYQVAAASLGIATLPGLAGVIADNRGLEQIGPFILVTAIVLFLLHEGILRQSRMSPTPADVMG